jgi:hypothetical protein
MKAIAIVACGLAILFAVPGQAVAEIETGFSSLTTSLGIFNGAGVSLGTTTGGGTSFGLSGVADVARFNDKTTGEVGLLWFRDSSRYTQAIPPVTATTEATLQNFSVLGGGKYTFQTSNPKLHPFLNGGLEIAFWSVSTSVRSDIMPEPLETSFSDTDVGIYVGGGMGYQTSDNLRLHGGLSLHTALSGYVQLGFGFTYLFGTSPAAGTN